MRKKENAFIGFVKKTIIPFITVLVISLVSILIYKGITEVTNDKLIIVAVMIATIIMLSSLFISGDLIRRKLTEKPLRELLDATEKIARGDFSVRLEMDHPYGKFSGYDLVKDNINAMVLALNKSETLNTDFISNVSHEIKTPLSIIKNYVYLLAKEKDENKIKEYSQIILQATERLNGLVTNMLKLNKLENQELKEKFEKIELHSCLAEAVLFFENAIEKKGIELECNIEEVELVSSKSLLDIVWSNLLSNAVKFTDKGGKIKVSLEKVGEKAIVSIADTGIGISKEVGEHIFAKFVQGNTSHSGEGNGLGLALVKKVIDLLGGEISVKSEVGKGTMFKVVLKGQ